MSTLGSLIRMFPTHTEISFDVVFRLLQIPEREGSPEDEEDEWEAVTEVHALGQAGKRAHGNILGGEQQGRGG